MMVEIPKIDFATDPETVRRNRALIATAVESAKALLSALEGLDKANKAICLHAHKQERWRGANYGGDSPERSIECDDCGARGLR